MTIGDAPAMFVSSTCYDLKQVRADIKSFIESLGIIPILSDYDSFPVNPDISAVENCLRVVDERADLFLLVVGGRYGSINDQGKSVTNLEYLRARAKGIPVYAFVQKPVLNILPVWKDNPEGNFQNIVDSPKLFEFVTSLMGSSGVWVFPFEVAQEITDTLRKQLAYLFKDALQLRRRIKISGLPESLAQLQGIPLRLVIEQPPYWEFRLFSHVLAQEIARVKRLRLDWQYGMTYGKGRRLDDLVAVMKWIGEKSAEAQRIVRATDQTVNVALQDALGPPGAPGDPESIVYVAKKLAEAYQRAIEWAIDFQHVAVEDELENLIRISGSLTSNMIKEIEDYSERILKEIEDAVSNLPPPGEQRVLHLTLTLTVPNMDEFEQEMDRINRLYGLE